ncbi:MAG: serine/threonine protein kinase [Deltaproteobacteria bacterium]|nr:serine/threonine protein kinase [Deltaproteobacteria bacterium]
MPPPRVRSYEVLDKIGTGGMAEVFRARRVEPPGVGKIVAIKQLSEELSADRPSVEMFIEEAQLAAHLTHPSIVQLLEYGTDANGRAFMVLEYIDGRDLRWVLAMAARARYWLPVDFALSIARNLCRALAFAHEARGKDGHPLEIVHRDVTHSNVFLSRVGEVKLADFGIARARGRKSQTRTGLVRGKIGYLSPEQIRSLPLDGRSDVFSASVVLWELLTQRRLFSGENEFKTMLAVCQNDRPPPSRHRPDVPQELDALVLKGVAIRREDRFASAREMERAIDSIARIHSLRLGPAPIAQVLEFLDKGQTQPPAKVASPAPTEPQVQAPIVAASVEFEKAEEPFRRGKTSIIPGIVPDEDQCSAIALREFPDRSLFVHTSREVLAVSSLYHLVRAIDPRSEPAVDAISVDRRHWLPVARFARLAELDFASDLRPIEQPAEKGGVNTLLGALALLGLSGFTGRFVVERPKRRAGLWFGAGGILRVTSSAPNHQLATALAASELISEPSQIMDALRLVALREQPLVQVLEAERGIKPSQLLPLRRALAVEVMRTIVALDEITTPGFSFEVAPAPVGDLIAKSPLELVGHASALAWGDADIEAALRPVSTRALALMPGLPKVARSMRLRRSAAPVLRELRAGRTVAQFLDCFPGGSEERRLAARLGLLLAHTGAIGLIDPAR